MRQEARPDSVHFVGVPVRYLQICTTMSGLLATSLAANLQRRRIHSAESTLRRQSVVGQDSLLEYFPK
jgi:hypothetical protein